MTGHCLITCIFLWLRAMRVIMILFLEDDVEYNIVRSARKTLCLSIDAKGNLIVRAPYRVSVDEIHAFVLRHEKWAVKHLAEHENTPKLNLINGSALLLFGKKYIIREGRSHISDDSIFLPVNGREEALKALLKRETAWYMQALTEKVASIGGFSIPNIRVSSARGRWGSYSKKGTVSYSFRIGFLPSELATYIAVHELCHSKCFDHSPAFWREVEKLLPDYRTRRKRLKNMSYVMNFL